MKVVEGYPPNYELIATALNPNDQAVFCYGDTIFNPGGRQLTEDVVEHERTHSAQQGSDPDGWYHRYLTDPAFRLEQEIEAYGAQYAFAKRFVKSGKLLRWALESMAKALSGEDYGSLIGYGAAESKIRTYAKRHA
jgi:hypothetical protein